MALTAFDPHRFHHVVALVGGVGGAKLAHGLAQILPPTALTVIVNTGDDFWHYGLRVCPDLDTVMYTLAGWVDPVNGWGVRGDTTITLDALRRYGEQPWFRLGDQDIATHLLRTDWLRQGVHLTEITRRLTARAGIAAAILPMTDSVVSTMIDTVEYGELEFQEYFVKHRWKPTARAIRFAGIADARPSEAVIAAIEQADLILIAPSNPYLSIDPIIRLPGLRALIESRPIPRAAITPIVQGQALKGPAAKLMQELGFPVSPQTVAEHYGSVINAFVYDERDDMIALPLLRSTALDTIMQTEADRATLAARVLAWLSG
jgi:LPPG:FO 2-phospho-L-lactate transferase